MENEGGVTIRMRAAVGTSVKGVVTPDCTVEMQFVTTADSDEGFDNAVAWLRRKEFAATIELHEALAAKYPTEEKK